MTEVRSTIIRASAGSGKTRALVRRIIRLLALGVQPESMVALTFTRKAAGEFFARLLQQLAEFTEKPEAAAAYLDELAGDTRAQCLRLLRVLLGNMDRLRLGTLDSFFAAMVQCLPFELGLSGAGTIMSEQQKKRASEEAFDSVLVELMRPENDAARREMMEAWKQATLGSEGNAPARDLASWFARLHEWHLDCPDEARWGAAETIWTNEEFSIWKADHDLDAARTRLEQALVLDGFSEKAVAKWREFFADLSSYRSGTPLTKSLKYMLEADRGDLSLLRGGRGQWKMFARKSIELGAEASRALYLVLQIIVGRELRASCSRTRARCRLVSIYERDYRRLVRSTGRLVFDDLTLLLTGKLNPTGTAGWSERWDQLRLDMEYRLNARYGHWLFDEFQDTSARQWRVFENLVDEVIQDAEGRRSFFAVGDLKQSIYLWREAEPELFLGIERRYEKLIHHESLSTSWRSCSQVLQMVNDTFGNRDALKQILPGALKWWAFEPHAASETTERIQGHSALLSVERKEEKDQVLIALLRKLQPVERGLTCAVLVRKNEESMRLASLLRKELSCEVVCESTEAVATDNPVTLALLSLLQLAAHPGDSFAWNHLQMTPLREWISRSRLSSAQVSERIRGEILGGGFLTTIEIWISNLRAHVSPLDDFSEWRLRQFLELCADFDGTGSRDLDAFLCFAREARVAAPGGSRALQVMTIHKSKGLEFDIVIMPDQQVLALDVARRNDLLWERDSAGQIKWLLGKPPASIVEWDGRLAPDVEQLNSRSAFEGMCRLYVGMTRAKCALYVLQHTNGNVSARSESGLTRDRLKETGSESEYALSTSPPVAALALYECGERDWFEQHEIKCSEFEIEGPDDSAGSKRPLSERLRAVCRPIQRRAPSGEENFQLRGGDLFTANREAGRDMGLLVHELFAAVEWFDGDVNALKRRWKSLGWDGHSGYEEAAKRVLACLEDRVIGAWFTQTDPVRIAWIERKFDMLHEGSWISGEPDRVILERDVSGAWKKAVILDFKTDSVSDETSLATKIRGYTSQLALYKSAVARLTGLDSAFIRSGLVFTDGALMRFVDAE